MHKKNPKVKLGLKNLAMSWSYFGCIFVHPRQKSTPQARIKTEFLSTLIPHTAQTRIWPK